MQPRGVDVGGTVVDVQDTAMEMIYDLVMIERDIADAKAHSSRCLDSIGKGETIVLCRRNVPVAGIRPLPGPTTLG